MLSNIMILKSRLGGHSRLLEMPPSIDRIEFLFGFYCNCGHILYRFQNKGIYLSKNAKTHSI